MPDHAIVISDTDLQPLLRDPAAIIGAIDAVEAATLAFHRKQVREANLEDRTPPADGPSNILQIHLAAHDSLVTGYQVFAETPGSGEGLPNSRFVTLLDPRTRELLALVPYIALSPVRVGATAGVACRYLAPANAKTAGIIGSSKQARGQLQAIWRTVPGLERVKVYSPTQANREAFARDMTSWLKLPVEAVSAPREAIEGADIVDLANSGREPVLDLAWVKPGALVMPIGGRQLPATVLTGTRIITTTWESLVNGREPFSAAIKAGTFTRDQVAGDLAQVILGEVPARTRPGETVVFDLARINIWAVAVAHWAYAWARDNRAGTSFSLV